VLATLKRKFIGDKAFYKMVLAIAMPIMIQNAITNFVGMLDNIMVGLIGTEQMTGVAIVNQIIFVYNLMIFGAVAGAGIFGAQYFGKGDHNGVRYAFRFKVIASLLLTVISIAVFIFVDDWMIMSYLRGEGNVENIEASLKYGKEYLGIMLVGFIPYALVQCYAGTLREAGETLMPMKAGIVAVLVNLALNAILIFGLLGFPAMGASGAAIATVVSRFVELIFVVIWTHKHPDKHPFIKGAFKSLYIPAGVTWAIFKKALPLILNESLWALSIALLSQCYSTRGYDVVSAVNITTTVSNLFNVAFLSLGSSVGIVSGQLLGAGDTEGAVDATRKMTAFSVASCLLFGGMLALVAPFFPMIYNTEPEIKSLASSLILVMAATMPINALAHSCYFTLRSGGRTFITILFDSGYAFGVVYPLIYALSHFTDIPIIPLFICCHVAEIGKGIIGCILVKKRIWVRNIVSDN
jgi:putative MATE family efflux protein